MEDGKWFRTSPENDAVFAVSNFGIHSSEGNPRAAPALVLCDENIGVRGLQEALWGWGWTVSPSIALCNRCSFSFMGKSKPPKSPHACLCLLTNRESLITKSIAITTFGAFYSKHIIVLPANSQRNTR